MDPIRDSDLIQDIGKIRIGTMQIETMQVGRNMTKMKKKIPDVKTRSAYYA